MATIKWCETGIVPLTTKALKMHIKNPHTTWEAGQLFLLSSTLVKKNQVTWKSPPRTCLHSVGQAGSDIDGAPESGELKSSWLWAAGALRMLKEDKHCEDVTVVLAVQCCMQSKSPCCVLPPAVATQLTKVRSRSWPKLTLSLKYSWHHCLCRCAQDRWVTLRQCGRKRNAILQEAKCLHEKWTY